MRIIGHLDMDAFFAAVEGRDHEWLRGLPVVVGADPNDGKGRGVVSTANYAAREYGIRSAQPISYAWRLSEIAKNQGKEPAIFLGTNFTRYAENSSRIMEILRAYTPHIEEASIDEAYFDLSFCGSFARAKTLCGKIKKEIQKKERLTASIGIAPNKLIAKIASDMQKPDGLTVVEEKDAKAFLEPLPIRKIPGIGPKTESFFQKKGIALVQDLKQFSETELYEFLGKWGLSLYEKIRGQDDSPLESAREAKSIGEQETFTQDSLNAKFIMERLSDLCQGVMRQFAVEGFSHFKSITLTVRFSDFKTVSRSKTLSRSANELRVLEFEALKLAMPFLDRRENPGQKPIRLIGIRIEKLISRVEKSA